MTKHVFSGTMPVDAGMIACIKKSYLEKFGPLRDTYHCMIMELPKGEIRTTVKNCWLGTPTALFGSDGSEYAIGDPCYVTNCGGWSAFLAAIDYGKNLPKEEGVIINTGGDGSFFVTVEALETTEATVGESND